MAISFAELLVLINPTKAIAGAKAANAAMTSMQVKAQQTSALMGGSFARAGGFIKGNVAVIGVALAGLTAAKSIKEFAEFDAALIGVSKTTDISGKALDRIGRSVIEMSGQIPVGADQLLGLAEIAGQLGVSGEQNILKFTKTVAQLGLAGNIAGEEAAVALARMLAITGESVDTVDVLASVIVRMGNNFAATEAEIARMGLELSAAGAQFGLTAAQALTTGAALRAMGVNFELARSTMLKTFAEMSKAIAENGEKLKIFAELAGLSTEQFAEAFKKDPNAVFQEFVIGLRNVIDTTGDAGPVLNSLGLAGLRVLSVLPRAAKAVELLIDANIQLADELANPISLMTELERRMESMDSGFSLLGNSIENIFIALGGKLAPGVISVTSAFTRLFTAIEKFVSQDIPLEAMFRDANPFIQNMVFSVGTLVDVWGLLFKGIGNVFELLFSFGSDEGFFSTFRRLTAESMADTEAFFTSFEERMKVLQGGMSRAEIAGAPNLREAQNVGFDPQTGDFIGLGEKTAVPKRDLTGTTLSPTGGGSSAATKAEKEADARIKRAQALIKKTDTAFQTFEKRQADLALLPGFQTGATADEKRFANEAAQASFDIFAEAQEKLTEAQSDAAERAKEKREDEARRTIEEFDPSGGREIRITELKDLQTRELIDQEVFQAAMLSNNAEFARKTREIEEQRKQDQRDLFEGTFVGDIAQAWRNLGDDITDTILEFTKTGKLNFKDMVDSFVDDLNRMIIERTITKPLMDFGESLLFGTGGSGGIFGGAQQGNVIPGHTEQGGGPSMFESIFGGAVQGFASGGFGGLFSGGFGGAVTATQARQNVSAGSFFDFEGGEDVSAFGGTGQGHFPGTANTVPIRDRFKHGGQFTVGGIGGADSQLVAFAATPGEQVAVSPSRASTAHDTTRQGSGRNVTVQNTFNIEGQVNKQSQQRISLAVGAAVNRTMARDT